MVAYTDAALDYAALGFNADSIIDSGRMDRLQLTCLRRALMAKYELARVSEIKNRKIRT